MNLSGSHLKRDYTLVRSSDCLSDSLPDLQTKLKNHGHYLLAEDFKEFRLFVPNTASVECKKAFHAFCSSLPIPGAVREYHEVDNSSDLNQLDGIATEEALKQYSAILPSADFSYNRLRRSIWEMSTKGKNLLILMADSVQQWNAKPSYFKRLFNKGAGLAFSGSPAYRKGWFYRHTLKKHHQYGLVKIWITPHLMDLDNPEHQRFLQYRERTFGLFQPHANDL
jgi:hypothetical protein